MIGDLSEKSGASPESQRRKLVVLDVDGVLFNGQYLLAISRRLGWFKFLLALWDAICFNLGWIRLETLLRRTYRRAKGMSVEAAWAVYQSFPLAPRCRETIESLHRRGHKVILLSAGAPDFIVKALAERIGADAGAGIILPEINGRLTGEVCGELARTDGKEKIISRLLRDEGWHWEDVVAVGDDPNNLPLMRRTGVSIGFRPTYRVRRCAQFVVDENDLTKIIPFVELSAHENPQILPTLTSSSVWHQEVRRKLVHGIAALLPLAASYIGHGVTWGLMGIGVLYLISEWFRLNGTEFPILGTITRWTIRPSEQRRMAVGPLTLALGVGLALLAFDRRVAFPCVLIVALADSAAALVGEHWGKLPIPYNRVKSVEGTLTFLTMATACAALYMPPSLALLAAGVAAFIESLPIQDWDNFCIPLGAGAAVTIAVRHLELFPGIGY